MLPRDRIPLRPIRIRPARHRDPIVWGASVVADSAQFSACVTELGDPRYIGTALTLQTSIGFLITTLTIRLLPMLVDAVGWRFAFVKRSRPAHFWESSRCCDCDRSRKPPSWPVGGGEAALLCGDVEVRLDEILTGRDLPFAAGLFQAYGAQNSNCIGFKFA